MAIHEISGPVSNVTMPARFVVEIGHFLGKSAEKFMRRILSLAFLLLVLPLAVPADANSPEVFSGGARGDQAIHGIDVMSYWQQGRPVKGNAKFKFTYKGSVWLFANRANLDKFVSDPDAYAPRYGGYCAYAAARGYLARTVPEAWSIYKGKLYLNYSVRIRDLWLQEPDTNIEKADEIWPQPLAK